MAYVPLNVRRQPFYVGAEQRAVHRSRPSLSGRLRHPNDRECRWQRLCLSQGDIGDPWGIGRGKNGDRAIHRDRARPWICWRPSCSTSCWTTALRCKSRGCTVSTRKDSGSSTRRTSPACGRTGYLDLLYAVMIASGQIFKLIRLKNQRIALESRVAGQRQLADEGSRYDSASHSITMRKSSCCVSGGAASK